VAERFLAGRGYFNESTNDPALCDLAMTMAFSIDTKSMDQINAWVDQALDEGSWLILAGHNLSPEGTQVNTTKIAVLEELCRRCTQPGSGIWIDSVAAIGEYIRLQRSDGKQ
jgi:peptidoglycan-N-acetylglucosamine deacetylase